MRSFELDFRGLLVSRCCFRLLFVIFLALFDGYLDKNWSSTLLKKCPERLTIVAVARYGRQLRVLFHVDDFRGRTRAVRRSVVVVMVVVVPVMVVVCVGVVAGVVGGRAGVASPPLALVVAVLVVVARPLAVHTVHPSLHLPFLPLALLLTLFRVF